MGAQADVGTGTDARRWGVRGTGVRGSRRHGRAGAWRYAGTGRAGRKRQARGTLGGTGARQAGRDRARGLGVLLGQWVVHSLHSACFWAGLTQYGA